MVPDSDASDDLDESSVGGGLDESPDSEGSGDVASGSRFDGGSVGTWIAVGIAIGTALGAATGQIAMGVAPGVVFGAAFGSIGSNRE